MEANKLKELIMLCQEGDCVICDEPNDECYKIKLIKKYPKGWKPKDGK